MNAFQPFKEEKDQQWKQAMDYLSAVSELNYMTQIVIMLYEDNNKVIDDLLAVIGRRHQTDTLTRCYPVALLLVLVPFRTAGVSSAGPLFGGAFPRGAALQPRGQRLRGRGKRAAGLRLPAGLFRGAFTNVGGRNDRNGNGCRLTNQNQDKKPNQGSLEDLSQDQTDQALLVSEPINILRRPPMIRNRKTGSIEVKSFAWMHFYPPPLPLRVVRLPLAVRFCRVGPSSHVSVLTPLRSSLRPRPPSRPKAARRTDSSLRARASRPRSNQPAA